MTRIVLVYQVTKCSPAESTMGRVGMKSGCDAFLAIHGIVEIRLSDRASMTTATSDIDDHIGMISKYFWPFGRKTEVVALLNSDVTDMIRVSAFTDFGRYVACRERQAFFELLHDASERQDVESVCHF